MTLYIVGGFVRDLLLNRPVNDFDLVTEGNAIHLARAFAQQAGGKVTMHPAFGTARWLSPHGETLDFISARSETYAYPGALPTVTFSTIEDDLRRRDFTINAMALRLDGEHWGELLDPLGGKSDLSRGQIRVLHSRSFVDDPTRLFRAVRYAVRYGFQIEPQTLALFNDEARTVLSTLSGERLRHELDLVFEEEQPAAHLLALRQQELLAPLHPALALAETDLPPLIPPPTSWGRFRFPSMFTLQQALGWLVWLSPLAEEHILSFSERLAFPTSLTRSARAASSLLTHLVDYVALSPSEWTAHLEKLPDLAIYAVYLRTQQSELAAYLSHWRHVRPNINGDDLKALGLPPGPHYQRLLWQLRAAWLDGRLTSELDEKRLLQTLLQSWQ
ncbi:MAG: CCA tRNA nucleotidyltransferase [Anaerolineae bacterium]